MPRVCGTRAGQPIRIAGSLAITANKEAGSGCFWNAKSKNARLNLPPNNATLAAHVNEMTAVNHELESLSYTIRMTCVHRCATISMDLSIYHRDTSLL